jgi:hypothetical protein
VEIRTPEGPLAPGKTGTIHLSLGTGHTRGKYKKIVEISTNDPQKTDVTLIMQATVVELLSVTPTDIDFGLVRIAPEGSRGADITKAFTITNRGTEPITINKITANPADQLTVFPLKAITLNPGDQQRLQARLTPKKDTRQMNGALVIKSDLSDLPEKIVHVSAEFVEGR